MRPFAFARPVPEGVELCVVRRKDDGTSELIIVPLAPLRAVELAHEITQRALPQMKADT